ncbi:MAG: hypothetical protein H6621_09420 [Halobacteriovoraceae bacterium]|nr:hypothetical protein [Halobacteriovoraceae bacterium]
MCSFIQKLSVFALVFYGGQVFAAKFKAVEQCNSYFDKVSKIFLRPYLAKFKGVIDHPYLYLWDNWGFKDGTVIHRYALAAPKVFGKKDRHFYAHWRHFISIDDGKTWIDMGAALNISQESDLFDSVSLWSGNIARLEDGRYLAAYSALGSKGKYLQSIGLAISDDAHHFQKLWKDPIISANKQKEEFIKHKYYFDYDRLGKFLEADGTIMSLRDPFIFLNGDSIHLFFAAKAYRDGDIVGAIGHAIIEKNNWKSVQILDPLIPPDHQEFKQLELPNVFKKDGETYLLVSTTKRTSEKQGETEIAAMARLYKLTGDSWNSMEVAGREDGSIIIADNIHYGANIIAPDFDRVLTFILSESSEKDLTLPAPIDLRKSDD